MYTKSHTHNLNPRTYAAHNVKQHILSYRFVDKQKSISSYAYKNIYIYICIYIHL